MFYWDRSLWELAQVVSDRIKPGEKDYPTRLTHYKEIFIGHTPISKTGSALPKKAATVWNIDTGAAFKGPVTIMDTKSKEFWQKR